jgi:hypothetical protein
MSLIPWPYRLLVLVLLAAALIGFGWVKGAGHVQTEWDAAVQQQTLQVATVRQKQAEATVKVVTQYVDRVRVVREKGDSHALRDRSAPPSTARRMRSVRVSSRRSDATGTRRSPTPKNARK